MVRQAWQKIIPEVATTDSFRTFRTDQPFETYSFAQALTPNLAVLKGYRLRPS